MLSSVQPSQRKRILEMIKDSIKAKEGMILEANRRCVGTCVCTCVCLNSWETRVYVCLWLCLVVREGWEMGKIVEIYMNLPKP